MELAVLTCQDFPETSPDCRIAVEELRSRGVQVTPVIWDLACVDSLRGFDLVLVRSIWDYQRKLGKFGSWLNELEASGVPVLNPAELMRWNYSKRYLRELHERSGISIIPTRWVGPDENLADVRALPWDELIVKPEISASADFTVRVSRQEPAAVLSAIRHAQIRGGALIQPFCESILQDGETSLVFFCDGRQAHLSHVVRKRPKTGDFRVQVEHGGTYERIDASREHRRFAEGVLAAIPHPWLYARIDIVEFEGQLCLGEAELIEPMLYFRWAPEAAKLFADCLLVRLNNHKTAFGLRG